VVAEEGSDYISVPILLLILYHYQGFFFRNYCVINY